VQHLKRAQGEGSGPIATPPKRTLPAEVRKEQLLTAARKVLAASGFSKMRISDVVREAGLSQGMFYLHFASKEDVVVELVRAMIAEAIAALNEGFDEKANMRAGVETVLGRYYAVCFRYRDVLESGDGGAAVGSERMNEVYKPLNEFAHRIIALWQSRGEIDPAAPTDVVSWLLIDTVNGALARLFGHSGDRISEDYQQHIVDWLAAALRSYPAKALDSGSPRGKVTD
jgi:AcrR family transcriptional regulator